MYVTKWQCPFFVTVFFGFFFTHSFFFLAFFISIGTLAAKPHIEAIQIYGFFWLNCRSAAAAAAFFQSTLPFTTMPVTAAPFILFVLVVVNRLLFFFFLLFCWALSVYWLWHINVRAVVVVLFLHTRPSILPLISHVYRKDFLNLFLLLLFVFFSYTNKRGRGSSSRSEKKKNFSMAPSERR